jgi:hypothetical protein
MCVEVTLILLNNGPRCKSSDAGNLDMPKRTHRIYPASEMAEVLNKEKKSYAEIYGKNALSSVKLQRRKKKIVQILLLYCKLQKLRLLCMISA